MQHLRPAITLMVFFTLLLGIAFPLGFVGRAGAVFTRQAGGSLVERNGVVVGSALIGQAFTTDRYFQGRPSAIATPYDAGTSSGSNLGPTSKALVDRVTEAAAGAAPASIPGDALTTSASGLDPHVSPRTAQAQVARVAAARGLPPERVRELVEANVEGRLLGLIGEPRVNVLALNIALDALPQQQPAAAAPAP